MSLDVTEQLADLALKVGEPADTTQQRFTSAQMLSILNQARNTVAEETRCFPVTDSQVVTPPTSTFSVTNDFIGLLTVEFGGRPLRVVQTMHWRDVVGDSDDISGDPCVATYHARQIKIFPVPRNSGTLLYKGWSYPSDLVLLGVESSYTDPAVRASIWEAAAILKGLDERNNTFEREQAERTKSALKKQYEQKGPRYVKTGDLYLPWRPLP